MPLPAPPLRAQIPQIWNNGAHYSRNMLNYGIRYALIDGRLKFHGNSTRSRKIPRLFGGRGAGAGLFSGTIAPGTTIGIGAPLPVAGQGQPGAWQARWIDGLAAGY